MKKVAPLLLLLLPLAAACGSKDTTPRATGIPSTTTTSTTLAPLTFDTSTTAPGETASGDNSTGDSTTTTNPDSPTSTASVGG